MIFQTHAPRYFELGIPVIPLKGKIPMVKDWQVWSEQPQTEEELEWLMDRFPNANIGAVMGLWATALDIDTDDPRVLTSVPYTPFRRKGKKGYVGIYARSALKNIGASNTPIELLNHGRQIVLPPSIHPETGEPYTWIGEEALDTSDLPPLSQFQFDDAVKVCKRFNIVRTGKRTATLEGNTPVCLTDTGRNNRLTSIAYAMACGSVPEEEAVDRLLFLDEREHTPPWFSDPTEPHRGRNPRATALRFYRRAVTSASARGHIHQDLIVNVPPVLLPPSWTPPPKPRGLMHLFQQYCNLTSSGDQSALGLGGAIALLSAIFSNRYYTEASTFKVWPNMFVMNLAHSGWGKETPQRALGDILATSGLLGSATYKSGSSVIMGLPEQPNRLDIIDECAMLLKAMGSREDYKADLVDVLSLLYSKSDGYFQGFTSKGDGKNFGACWNPCVNILGSTTPAGFKSSVSRDMAAKGLLPRFLIFWQKELGQFKENLSIEDAERVLAEIKRMVSLHLSTEYRTEDVQTNLLNPAEPKVRFLPEFIPMTEGAQKAFQDIRRRFHEQIEKDPESFDGPFKNRFAQHTAKLALLDALGLGLAEVGVDSIDWAYSVVEWQWHTVKELYELANAESETGKQSIQMLQYIRSKGQVSQSDLTRRFSYIPMFARSQIINSLIDAECIARISVPPSGEGKKSKTTYQFLKSSHD